MRVETTGLLCYSLTHAYNSLLVEGVGESHPPPEANVVSGGPDSLLCIIEDTLAPRSLLFALRFGQRSTLRTARYLLSALDSVSRGRPSPTVHRSRRLILVASPTCRNVIEERDLISVFPARNTSVPHSCPATRCNRIHFLAQQPVKALGAFSALSSSAFSGITLLVF